MTGFRPPFTPTGRWTTRQLAVRLPILNAAALPHGLEYRPIEISTFADSVRWYLLVPYCRIHSTPIAYDAVCEWCLGGITIPRRFLLPAGA